MIAKTEAIPIRISPFGGTSHIVTWVTPDAGIISTVIKGACRARRTGGGQYDLGYRCELLYYERDFHGMHTFKDCEAIETRQRLRGRWRETNSLSYLCLLAGTGAAPAQHTPTLYNTLLSAITCIEEQVPLTSLLLWFELQMLRLHGMAPHLDKCTACRCHPTDTCYLAADVGGLLCAACAQTRGNATRLLTASTLTLLRQLQRLKRPIPATHANASGPAPADAIAAMADMTTTWLDVAPAARTVAFQMANLHLNAKKRSVAFTT